MMPLSEILSLCVHLNMRPLFSQADFFVLKKEKNAW
jgi:hypothetical protein